MNKQVKKAFHTFALIFNLDFKILNNFRNPIIFSSSSIKITVIQSIILNCKVISRRRVEIRQDCWQ